MENIAFPGRGSLVVQFGHGLQLLVPAFQIAMGPLRIENVFDTIDAQNKLIEHLRSRLKLTTSLLELRRLGGTPAKTCATGATASDNARSKSIQGLLPTGERGTAIHGKRAPSNGVQAIDSLLILGTGTERSGDHDLRRTVRSKAEPRRIRIALNDERLGTTIAARVESIGTAGERTAAVNRLTPDFTAILQRKVGAPADVAGRAAVGGTFHRARGNGDFGTVDLTARQPGRDTRGVDDAPGKVRTRPGIIDHRTVEIVDARWQIVTALDQVGSQLLLDAQQGPVNRPGKRITGGDRSLEA